MTNTSNERIVSGSRHEDDQNLDTSLRPRRLKDYVGQNHVKSLLEISIRLHNKEESHSTIYYYTALPGLGKRH